MLQGKLVRLRPKRKGDALRDYSWATDPELAKLDATFPLTYSLPHYLLIYNDELLNPAPGSHRFAMETLKGRRHIGNISHYDDLDSRQVELGILIGDKAYWGRGYGTDAITTLMAHLFGDGELGLDRIYLHTLEWNLRAQTCFRKCGFVPCGQSYRNGHNLIQMEIYRRDWAEAAGTEACLAEGQVRLGGTARSGGRG